MNPEEQKIASLFINLLGITPKLKSLNNPNQDSPERELFKTSIEEWGLAWRQQNTLFNKYGIDLSGYDTLLYSSIEGLINLMYGPVKSQVIAAYVYNKSNTDEDYLKIEGTNNSVYYIKNIDELYDFIHSVKEEDLLIDDEDDDED
jgi:hypothetical protein